MTPVRMVHHVTKKMGAGDRFLLSFLRKDTKIDIVVVALEGGVHSKVTSWITMHCEEAIDYIETLTEKELPEHYKRRLRGEDPHGDEEKSGKEGSDEACLQEDFGDETQAQVENQDEGDSKENFQEGFKETENTFGPR